MKITKSFLRHELQNIFMIMAYFIEEGNQKEDCLKLLNLASLLLEYESFLSREKVDFFVKPTSLEEVFEILILSEEEKIKAQKTQIKTTDLNITLQLSRDYFIRAFSQIFEKVLEKSTFVEIQFQPAETTIAFLYDSDCVAFFREEPLEKLLNDKIKNFQKIAFQISLSALREFGCILIFEKNAVKIALPDSVKKF